MPKIFIDGKTYEVKSGKNLLEICLSLDINLPYFCWHPALGSVGACRQCAVKSFKDENDKTGRLIMSCMEPVKEGMRISIEDSEAKEFRKAVVEWLMTNHPHDCPVCDEGGECHLQDMTVMTGHNYRRYNFKKRTYTNQYLGPFINHEMNRCIQCYRCVRFYKDYAQGNDFDVFAIHNSVYFGRSEDGVLESEFSGNLVEVCPTGVFTDKTLKQHYTRKWDLTSAPSICTNCGLGCNTIAAERYGSLRRILSRYNSEVNGYFLCDRGRFGYEYVNSPKRLMHPVLRNKKTGEVSITSDGMILNEIKNVLSKGKVFGIGSPRASLESNFALRKLVGKDNFFMGISDVEHKLISLQNDILINGSVKSASLKETEKADTVFILGEDITNTAPMLSLYLRQSILNIPKRKAERINLPLWQDAAVRELIQDEKGPFYIVSPYKTKLDDIATKTYRASPDDIARLGFAVSGKINKTTIVNNLTDEEINLSDEISNALLNAENALIVSGFCNCNININLAAADIAWSLNSSGKNVKIIFTVPECNSRGAVLLEEKNLNDVMNIEVPPSSTIIILENDLYRRNTKEVIDNFINKFENVIVLDYLENTTTNKANFLIPAGTFAESDGTFVNNEGRAQCFYQVFAPDAHIKESWRWISEISDHAEEKKLSGRINFFDFVNELVTEESSFVGIRNLTPPPGFRIAGEKIPRQPHRFSGRTAMHANVNVHEPKPVVDVDSPLSFTMEGYKGKPPSELIPFFWSPGWNSAQAINKYQIEVGGPLHRGDPGKRLFEANGTVTKINQLKFFKDIPPKFEKREKEFLVIPVYHIYGSEELSIHSPGIAELATKPYVSMNPIDAKKMNLNSGNMAIIKSEDVKMNLPVIIDNSFPDGVAGLPFGLINIEFLMLPAWATIEVIK